MDLGVDELPEAFAVLGTDGYEEVLERRSAMRTAVPTVAPDRLERRDEVLGGQ